MPTTRRFSGRDLREQFDTKKKASNSIIGYVAKGDTDVRFLTEPDGWWQAFLHYYQDQKKYIWCTKDDGDCQGCADNVRPKEVWLANVLNRKDGNKVQIIQMPYSLASQLFERYKRRKTITDRDMTLIREGEGLNTEYRYDPLDPSRIDLKKYRSQLFDGEEIIEKEVAEQNGDTEEPRSTKSKKSSRKSSRDDDYDEDEYDEDDEDFDEEEDDEEEEAPRRPSKRKPAPKRKPSRRSRHEDEDDEDEDEDDEDDDEDYDGLDEFRPEKSRHPEARRSSKSGSRVVRRTRR